MKRRFQWKVAAAAIAAAIAIWLIAGVILAGREPLPPPISSQPMTLRGGIVNGNRISTKSWTFVYKSAQLSPDGTLATIDGLRKGILYKKGKPYLSIAASHVSVNTQTFDFTAVGDVHVGQLQQTGGVQRSFDTDFVQWINGTKTLTLPHPSIVRGGGELLKVASIAVDFNTGNVKFGPISGGFIAP